MPSLTRQQIMAWGAVALVVLLIGGNYLRGHFSTPERDDFTPLTVGLKEDATAAARVKVHVVGAVVNPGLYELVGESRVADALTMAGGATVEADLTQVNLAAKIADGQQLVVPIKGVAPSAGAAAGAPTGSGAGSPAGQPVNLNTASQAQLEELDGVGPKTAEKIIDYRTAHGGFKSLDELMEVEGIGPSKFDRIKQQVVV